MNILRSMLLLVAAALTGVVVDSALAEDFVFTVPMRLTNLHTSVTNVRLLCQALDASGGVMGGRVADFPVDPQTGTLSQDVVVKFDVVPQKVASNAVQYKCWFELGGQPPTVTHPPIPADSQDPPGVEEGQVRNRVHPRCERSDPEESDGNDGPARHQDEAHDTVDLETKMSVFTKGKVPSIGPTRA